MILNFRRGILLLGSIVCMTAAVPATANDPVSLTVHEWGTFTSIAGEDGGPVEWLPLSGPQDLPCFVDRLRFNFKAGLFGTVRMETPVVYLYAPEEMTVDLSVRFRQGLVTEWFPRAAVSPSAPDTRALLRPEFESRITWNDVKVSPRATPDYPTERSPSHYYAARLTDASPLRSGPDEEKFLFYRGVGRFSPPLTAILGADGSVAVRNPSGDAIGQVIFFENREGAIGYRFGHAAGDRLSISAARLGEGSLPALRLALERMLVAKGLYPKEASAMVETWRDSWFEEGSRLFYIAPPDVVNSILPLEVEPKPTEVARVFVGRLELVTPRMMREVTNAVLAGDRRMFAKYGRFVGPIASRIVRTMPSADRAPFEERLNAAYASYYASAPPMTCQ
jgi:hypothetical protein